MNHDQLKLPSGRFYQNPEGFALQRYQYFLCHKCQEPYFGGKRECEQAAEERAVDPSELVCPKCSGGSDTCGVHGKEFMSVSAFLSRTLLAVGLYMA